MSEITLTKADKLGIYRDQRGRTWLWNKIGAQQHGLSMKEIHGWCVEGYCRALNRSLHATWVGRWVVLLASEYPAIKRARDQAIRLGVTRLSQAEAHEKHPAISLEYLSTHANKFNRLLDRKFVAPMCLLRSRCDENADRNADGNSGPRFHWGPGFLPADLEELDSAMQEAQEKKPAGSKRLTAGEAFKKYRHWIKDAKGGRWAKNRSPERNNPKHRQLKKYQSFVARLKTWHKHCHWLEGPLDVQPEARRRRGGGVMLVDTYDPQDLETIDQRIKAQREGVWYRDSNGRWYSAAQFRDNEHQGRDVVKYLTAATAIARYRVAEKSLRRWAIRCVYLKKAIETETVKTYARNVPGFSGNAKMNGYETVWRADPVAEATRISSAGKRHGTDERYEGGDESDLAPVSVLSREHGISVGYFYQLAAKHDLHPTYRKVRVGSKRDRMKLFSRSAVEKAFDGNGSGNGDTTSDNGQQQTREKSVAHIPSESVSRIENEQPVVEAIYLSPGECISKLPLTSQEGDRAKRHQFEKICRRAPWLRKDPNSKRARILEDDWSKVVSCLRYLSTRKTDISDAVDSLPPTLAEIETMKAAIRQQNLAAKSSKP